ncbi:hypothetical protein FIBSPDRAFT_73666 [Athelia psychrophila]|uniref:Uncharacterized protein n=1 Tax=Athelia psychrophila TaxID=1759441 RepID=A0A166EN55_9AGAM|nr:hypothetical protein FIBSPDRAFT_560770 [Fibularhizoctonia sp. CBS 109695]KZP15928.1 hypothetical protein FIBSPDRAFT_73666 [Fibularhizoctonia sp. CBS 109695]
MLGSYAKRRTVMLTSTIVCELQIHSGCSGRDTWSKRQPATLFGSAICLFYILAMYKKINHRSRIEKRP